MTSLLLILAGCVGETAPPATDPQPPPPIPVTSPAVPPAPLPPGPAADGAVLPDATPVLPTGHAKSPTAKPSSPELDRTRARLVQIVDSHALDKDDPWAIKHAMVAYGADPKLGDGTSSADWLFQRYAREVTVGGRDGVEFPAKDHTSDGHDIRVEPHGDLLLKGLAEARVPADRVFGVQGDERTVGDLWRTSLARTWVDGDKLWTTSWNDTPWTLFGLAAYSPGDVSWTAVGGHPMSMDLLTHAVVARLHSDTQFIRDSIATGTPFEKRKQGIFAYTCGGQHMIQGAAYAVARGFGEDGDRASIEAEVPALYARWPVETKQVADALVAAPEYRTVLLDQRLKFLGHFLETAHELAAEGFYTPDAAQQAILDQALLDLVTTVDTLDSDGTWAQLDALKANPDTYQLYLDLVGDSAHAIHGIDLATGSREVWF